MCQYNNILNIHVHVFITKQIDDHNKLDFIKTYSFRCHIVKIPFPFHSIKLII